MTNVDKEAVRAASRLEDVIPALIGGALTPRGREVVTRCPFRQDTRPSLRMTSKSNSGGAMSATLAATCSASSSDGVTSRSPRR